MCGLLKCRLSISFHYRWNKHNIKVMENISSQNLWNFNGSNNWIMMGAVGQRNPCLLSITLPIYSDVHFCGTTFHWTMFHLKCNGTSLSLSRSILFFYFSLFSHLFPYLLFALSFLHCILFIQFPSFFPSISLSNPIFPLFLICTYCL